MYVICLFVVELLVRYCKILMSVMEMRCTADCTLVPSVHDNCQTPASRIELY